ncbi:hypothetical protein AAG906_003500 [Vitis piasezkii]
MSEFLSSNKASLLSPTSSRSVTETVNGSHKFVIQGYSLAKGMGVGKHIASENFTVGGYQWAIYFYPDGKNPEDHSTYVSVFIALASEGTDVRALFELTLVDQSGKGKHKVHSHFDRSLESGPYTLKYRGDLLSMLRDYKISSEEDSVFWKGGGNGIFGVKDAYKLLVAPNDFAFLKKCIPTKAAFCLGGHVGEDSYPR